MRSGPGRPDSYAQAALRLFEEFGDREALVDGVRRLTFAELGQAVLDMAANLTEQGVEPGSAALVMVTNSVEGPILHLSLHLLGCRSMWIAPVTSRREMLEFTNLAKPDLFIYDTRSPGEIGREIAAALPGVPVLRIGPGTDLSAPRPPGAVSRSAAAQSLQARSRHEPEAFLQTSGTTGTPKLVHHKQGFYVQILALAEQFRAAGHPLLRHLSHSPMWLASGQMTTLFNLFTGGVLFLREEWDPAAFLRVAEVERITSTFLTPPMLYEVLDHPDCERADLSSMFMFNVGAGPAAPSRLRQAIARFGPVLRIVYGLSEAVVITALPGLTEDPEHPERLSSCGRPYGDVQIEIRGTADGSRAAGGPDGVGGPLPAGQTGEVWVRSKLSFSGYHGQPELTAATIVDGWVRTRDLGYLDSDGYLYLVDRVHDMIVTHRRNWAIFCRPIEDALAEHPQVRAAAVIGVPDGTVGEAPHAYVVRAEGGQVTEAELIALVSRTLNEMWAPHSVDFVDRLPRNRSAKVDKQALRAAWAQQHARDEDSSTSSGRVE